MGGFNCAAAEKQKYTTTQTYREDRINWFLFVFLPQCLKVRINVVHIVIRIFSELFEVSSHWIVDGELYIVHRPGSRHSGGVGQCNRKFVAGSQRTTDGLSRR